MTCVDFMGAVWGGPSFRFGLAAGADAGAGGTLPRPLKLPGRRGLRRGQQGKDPEAGAVRRWKSTGMRKARVSLAIGCPCHLPRERALGPPPRTNSSWPKMFWRWPFANSACPVCRNRARQRIVHVGKIADWIPGGIDRAMIRAPVLQLLVLLSSPRLHRCLQGSRQHLDARSWSSFFAKQRSGPLTQTLYANVTSRTFQIPSLAGRRMVGLLESGKDGAQTSHDKSESRLLRPSVDKQRCTV